MILLFLVILGVLGFWILRELDGEPNGVEDGGQCPGCGRRVESDWLLCPDCRCLLRQGCTGCGRAVAVWQHFCPWCGQNQEKAL